jgi:hypothetical protein
MCLLTMSPIGSEISQNNNQGPDVPRSVYQDAIGTRAADRPESKNPDLDTIGAVDSSFPGPYPIRKVMSFVNQPQPAP